MNQSVKFSGQTLAAAGPDAHVADIKYHDGPILIPNGMDIPTAVGVLEARQKYLETAVNMSEVFDVFPYDGANGLVEVLSKMYGWANSIPTPGFFGDSPPAMISINVGYMQKRSIPWGRFSMPGVAGYLETDVQNANGRFKFKLSGEVLRKDEAQVKRIFSELREFLKTGSIYKGKAIKIRFLTNAGKPLPMPEPEFLPIQHITRDMAIYSAHIHDAIETNLMTPIERVQDCLDNNLPVKRSVLLGGTYGTGKTLAATVASKVAVDNGLTYLYVPRADELKLAIEFLKQYQSPAGVLFCEDIDRVISGERTVEMDDILNIVDGIDTKSTHLITVLTTNDLNAINPAMIRPGRLDCVIEVTAPDAKAVERLIRHYASNSLAPDADITAAGVYLEGSIPAVVAEVVKRAKLVELKSLPKGSKITGLSGQAIIESAATMKGQLDLLQRLIDADAESPPTLGELMEQTVREALVDVTQALQESDNDMKDVRSRLGIPAE